MNVATLLLDQAQCRPEHLAIIDRSGKAARSITFAELNQASALAAAHFTRAGLEPGDRVVVFHPMTLDLYVALAGLFRAGLVPTFCDPAAGQKTVERCCARVKPHALFAAPVGFAYAATVPTLARLGRRFTPQSLRRPRMVPNEATTIRQDHDPALITFTSGSTSTPKVVVRSHALLRAQLNAIREVAPAAEVEISTMPIVLLANLASGTTSIIPAVDLRRPGSADPKQLADDVTWSGATSIVASPAMLEKLVSINSGDRLVTLRRIVSGGAPVMPRLMQRLQLVAPDAEILAMYGSTEAEPIARIDLSAMSAADIAAMREGAGLLAGCPTPSSMVRIVNGEITVTGDHVVPGYLDAEGDSETKLRVDGRIWHRTGDGGYFDAQGRIWLTGRKVAEVRDAKGALNPFSVETALSFDPKIARSAVVGAGGRRIAVVETRSRRHPSYRRLNRTLRWASIDDIRVVRHIPVDRRHNAKVDYPALRRLVKLKP